MRKLKRTAISMAATQVALLCCGAAMAQTDPAPASAPAALDSQAGTDGVKLEKVIIKGQRAALASAQKLKQNAEEIVDSVVAEDALKLPDKSVTEVLQRVVGVTIDRNRSHGDPEHFSVEGSGVQIRGLTWGASNLNGRESFSAGWPGRELSWGDVPPELMGGVDVHKNPSAEQIEGAVSGLVNLRTRLPFDFEGTQRAISLSSNYAALGDKNSPAASGLISTKWDAESGKWGLLLDVSHNQTTARVDDFQLDAYLPRTDVVPGKTVWVPQGASWRTNQSENDRAGFYGALQWKKNDMESSLTYFQSDFRERSTENAMRLNFPNGTDARSTQIADGVFDSNGVFQSGTYKFPTGSLGGNQFGFGGVGFNTTTGYSENTSNTKELAWNFKWKANDQWSFQNDLQWVHSEDNSMNSVVSLGTFVPSYHLDTTGSTPKLTFDQAATNVLANPANYYWDNFMPQMSRDHADLYAWKADARFNFDNAVLRDLRFGVRLTERESTHENASGSGWTSIAKPWDVQVTGQPGTLPTLNSWQSRGNVGYLGDPNYAAYAGYTTPYAFSNFGFGAVPNVVMPSLAAAQGYPASYQALIQQRIQLCKDGQVLKATGIDCTKAASDWVALNYNGDPAQVSQHSEDTQAFYGTLRFGFDDWKYPVEGNVGTRVVRTHTVAHGYTVFTPGTNNAPSVPAFGPINAPLDVESTSTDVIPSLNLKMKLSDKLQTRLALSQGMYRPGFDKLQEYITLNQNVTMNGSSVQQVSYTGTNTGNANLKPVKSNNFDASVEWYPHNGSFLTAGVFYKEVKDIIYNTAYTRTYKDLAGNPQDFQITGPDNVASGRVGGLEIAGSTYFSNLPGLDKALPDWAKGFGISANYTYLDSKQSLYHNFNLPYCPAHGSFNNTNINIYGCDTNGLPFKDLPLPYMSKNAFNLAFMYDRGPISARLAYSWRSRFLQSVGSNGTNGQNGTSADPTRIAANAGVAPVDVDWGLPTWQEDSGQWDAGVDYKVGKNISLSFSVTNLTDVVTLQTQQQGIGMMGRSWFEPGRGYKLSMNYTF